MADGFQNEAPVKHGDRAAYPLTRITREPSWGQKTKNVMALRPLRGWDRIGFAQLLGGLAADLILKDYRPLPWRCSSS